MHRLITYLSVATTALVKPLPHVEQQIAVRFTTCLRRETEAHHRNRQIVEQALPIRSDIEQTQQCLTDQVERQTQVATAAIEAAALGQVGKQMRVRLPFVQHIRLFVPAPTLAHHSQREQFTVDAHRLRTRMSKQGSDFLPDFVDDIGPQAKVVKMRYLFVCPPERTGFVWR